MVDIPDFGPAKANTQAVYEQNAEHWDRQRSRRLYERKWLDKFINALPESATVLDLGCGGGEPVADYLISKGLALTGIDFAKPMIDIASARFPDHDWLVGDMRDIQLDQRFDGIISWDGFFHLSQSEQRQFFDQLHRWLKPSATLLFTVGTGDGEVTGTVAGETVYHASLAPEEYRDILQAIGFETVEITLEDEEALGRSILFAL